LVIDGEPRTKTPSGMACDSWNLYKKDTQLIKQLGMNSYRMSIEWSKIEPQQGTFDEEAIKHYHDVIDDLLQHNIQPMITLFHFTVPLWFYEVRNKFLYVTSQMVDEIVPW
jgi:beta-glucosidase